MNINPEDKMIKNGRIEKWVLREAFKDYLPESVLWRQKEQFSDGVGYSWIDSLKELVSKEVTDNDLKNASNVFPINTPRNKRSFIIDLFLMIIFLVKQLLYLFLLFHR
jgi:asparagine synthase (glutamine-hydrolysing)